MALPWRYARHYFPDARGHFCAVDEVGPYTVDVTGAAAMTQERLDASMMLVEHCVNNFMPLLDALEYVETQIGLDPRYQELPVNIKAAYSRAHEVLATAQTVRDAAKKAVTTGKVPIDIGGGYTVVPFGAVTLNGTFLSQLMESADGTLLVVIGPDGRALMGEGGRPYRYQTLDECRRDVETLMSVPGWKESK